MHDTLPPENTPDERRQTLPRMTDRMTLGREGLRVGPICLGRVIDPRAIPAAFDAGVNFFFVSADMHWPIYEESRKGLEMLLARGGGVRDEIVVGVVSYVTQPVFCHMPFVEVIDAVKGLQRIDLTIVGGTYANEFLVRLDEYRDHRSGRAMPPTRAVGATFHDRRAAAQAVRGGLVDVAFARYNPIHRGAEEELFPIARERLAHGGDGRTRLFNFLSTHGYLPERAYAALNLSEQHWRPKVTDYYRFALGRPEIDGVLCAPDTPARVAALAAALEEGPLTDEEDAYLRDLADLSTGEASLAPG